jgi:hypothetical protein
MEATKITNVLAKIHPEVHPGISYHRLDDLDEHPHHADDETDPGQRKGIFLDEDRQNPVDEEEIEIV